MTTEDWINGEWIRERLLASGRSQRQFALALGIDPSGVSRLLDGRRQLKIDEIRMVREFFEGPPTSRSRREMSTDRPREEADKRRQPGPRPRNRLSADIPVYAATSVGRPPYLEIAGGPPAEYRTCPPQLSGVAGAFGLFVPDDGLAPRFRGAETVYIHPSRPPRPGSDVFIRFNAPKGRVALARYLSNDGPRVRFTSVNASGSFDRIRPDDELTVEAKDVAQIGLIVVIAAW